MRLIMIIIYLLLSFLLEVLWFLLYPVLFIALGKISGNERLGIGYPKSKFDIIVHAASVGEVNGIKPLLLSLLDLHPDYQILLTVNTGTGRKAGTGLHPAIQCQISPLDIMHLRLRQMKLSKPKLLLIAETEIWLTQLYAAKLYKIPVVFINARISAKTVSSYQHIKPVLNWIAASVKLICTQSESDTRLFGELFTASPLSPVILTGGNLKFAVKLPDYDGGELRKAWGYQADDKILVIGSSRPGEEALLLNCFDILIRSFPSLKLIVAPRHLNRLDELKNLVKGRDVSYFSSHQPAGQIHIIDTLGHLLPAYAMADIAIIGGSYFQFGGHNPLEAAFYAKVIMMGEDHRSCQDSVNCLLAKEAIIINNAETFCSSLAEVLAHPAVYQSYGTRAQAVLAENSNSLDCHLEQIGRYLG